MVTEGEREGIWLIGEIFFPLFYRYILSLFPSSIREKQAFKERRGREGAFYGGEELDAQKATDDGAAAISCVSCQRNCFTPVQLFAEGERKRR